MKKSFRYDLYTGLACIYKNQNQSNTVVLNNFKLKLQQGAISQLKKAPLGTLIRVHDEHVGSRKPLVSMEPDFSTHELVCGPPFELEEFECSPVNPLSKFASGVQVIGVNDGGKLSKQLADCLMMRVYHIDAFFGRATKDGTVAGKTIAKTPWQKVDKLRFEKVLASLQAEHQKAMFTYSGVPKLTSPEAYRLAISGFIRPPNADTPPVLYGIKCTIFDLPQFRLEVHAINENCQYLADLVHDLGARMKSSACCLKIRRVQQGPFTVDDALLDKHWTLQHVAENIATCTEKGQNVIANLNRDTIVTQKTDEINSESDNAAIENFTKNYKVKLS